MEPQTIRSTVPTSACTSDFPLPVEALEEVLGCNVVVLASLLRLAGKPSESINALSVPTESLMAAGVQFRVNRGPGGILKLLEPRVRTKPETQSACFTPVATSLEEAFHCAQPAATQPFTGLSPV